MPALAPYNAGFRLGYLTAIRDIRYELTHAGRPTSFFDVILDQLEAVIPEATDEPSELASESSTSLNSTSNPQ